MGPCVYVCVCGCTCRMCVCISFLKLEYQLRRCVIVSDVHVIPGWLQFAWYAGHTRPPPRNKFTDYYLVHTPRAHHRAGRSACGAERVARALCAMCTTSRARLRSNIYGRPGAANHAPRAHAYIYAKIKFYAYNARRPALPLQHANQPQQTSNAKPIYFHQARYFFVISITRAG
jgi:hypothetical protein